MSNTYDVYISHAGVDKETLAIPLYRLLKKIGVRAFVDSQELKPGDDFQFSMEQAMSTAPVGVFILSPEFASRKWPMKELFRFLQRFKAAEAQSRKPPILIPIYCRMSSDLSTSEDLFRARNAVGDMIFLTTDFYDRVASGETSRGKILSAMEQLSKYAGHDATFIQDLTMSQQTEHNFANFVGRVAEKIEAVVLMLKEPDYAPAPATSQGTDDTQTIDPSSLQSRQFIPFFDEPRPMQQLVIDFESMDQEGNPVTAEGKVKQILMSYGPHLKAANIVSLLGPSGVGKSSCLNALLTLEQLKKRFPDGIYFLALGIDAGLTSIAEKLRGIIERSGGKSIASSLRDEPDFDIVLQATCDHFHGRTFLFLVDDLWQRNQLGQEYLPRLRLLLSSGNGSWMVFTTRFSGIVEGAETVEMKVRDCFGPTSRKILCKHASCSEAEVGERSIQATVTELLRICQGLPLSLALVGKSILMLLGQCGGRRNLAWTDYYKLLRGNETPLPISVEGKSTNLEVIMSTSLNVLGSNPAAVLTFRPRREFAEMYQSLCVLKKAVRVPVDVIRVVWGIDNNKHTMEVMHAFEKVGLASVEPEGDISAGMLTLAPDVHWFAGAMAERTKSTAEMHKCFLEELIRPVDQVVSSTSPSAENSRRNGNGDTVFSISDEEDVKCCLARCIETLCLHRRKKKGLGETGNAKQAGDASSAECRPWWSTELKNDGYLHANLGHHLVGAGLEKELCKLLLKPQWLARQLEVAGYSQLAQDFNMLLTIVESGLLSPDMDTVSALNLVFSAVRLEISTLTKNQDEIWFQLYGRLLGSRNTSEKIKEFLDEVERCAKKPWVKPLNQMLEPAGQKAKEVIPDCSQVYSIALMNGGHHVVSGCLDGQIYLIDRTKQMVTAKWKAHSSRVNDVLASPDGKRLVSCSRDGTVKVWFPSTKIQAGETIKEHKASVNCIALTPNGRHIVSGSSDKTICIWDMETQARVCDSITFHDTAVSALTVSPDGNLLLSSDFRGHVLVWNLEKMRKESEFRCGVAVRCMAIINDNMDVICGHYGGMETWSIARRERAGKPFQLPGGVLRFALSSDATRVVSAGFDEKISVWDMSEPNKHYVPLKGHKGWVRDVKIDANGDVVSCSGDGTVRVWSIGESVTAMERDGFNVEGIQCIAVTPDETKLVAGFWNGRIQLWDSQTMRKANLRRGFRERKARTMHLAKKPFEGHHDLVQGIAVTPDGSRVVSVSDDKSLRVWKIRTGEQEQRFDTDDELHCVAVMSHGKVVTGSRLGKVCIRSIKSRSTSEMTGRSHKTEVKKVYVSSDGHRIVSASLDEIIVWDVGRAKYHYHYPYKAADNWFRWDLFHAVRISVFADNQLSQLRCRGNQIFVGEHNSPRILATMEDDIVDYVVVPHLKKMCVVLKTGRLALLEVHLLE